MSLSIEAELVVLATLDRAALAERWVAVFDCPAPRNCQAPLLRGALAWQLQMQASTEWRRSAGSSKLKRALRVPAAPVRSVASGTRLLREWQGGTHQVLVLDAGFEYDGVVYRSLSAIARRITGTPWSGPMFFGLKS